MKPTEGRRLIMLSALLLGILLGEPLAIAVEVQSSQASGESVSTEAAPQDAMPPKAVSPAYLWPDITGLIMQPLYLAVKIPVAVGGAIMGAVGWVMSGGDRREAQGIWDASMGGPWGWPEFVRGLGKTEDDAP